MGNPFSKSGGFGGSNPFKGGSAGGSSARGRLAGAVGEANKTGDKGLIGFAKGLADKVGLDSAANVVMRGLSIADLGRSAVLSAGVEALDLLGGGTSRIRDTDRVQQSGFSWDDFVTNTKNHMGFGDVVEADPATDDLPIWVKRGLGFVGDVAADPLTYVSGGLSVGAKGAEEAGSTLGRRTLISTNDAASRLVRSGDTAAAEAVLGARSGAAVPRSVLQEVGVERGVYLARRYRIKSLDYVYDVSSYARGQARKSVAELFARKLSPETLRRFERTPGFNRILNNPALKREGINNVMALQWSMGWRDSGVAARDLKRDLSDQLDELFNRFKDVDPTELRRDLEAVGPEATDAGKAMREFFDDAIDQVNARTGASIPKLNDYLTHVLTSEARESGRGAAGVAGAAPGLKRNIEGSIEDINKAFWQEADDAIKAKYGFNSKNLKLFKDNPWEIANEYLNQVERFVRWRTFEKSMAEAGLFKYFNKGVVRDAVKLNKALERQAKRLGKRAGRGAIRRDAAQAEAADLRGEIAGSPFRAKAADKAQEVEDQLLDVGADVDSFDVRLDEIDSALQDATNQVVDLEQRAAGLPDAEQAVARQREVVSGAQETLSGAQKELEAAQAVQPVPAPEKPTQRSLEAVGKELKTAQKRAQRARAAAVEADLDPLDRLENAVRAARQAGENEQTLDAIRAAYRTRNEDVMQRVEQRFGLTARGVPLDQADELAQAEDEVAKLTAERASIKKTKSVPEKHDQLPDQLAARITAAKAAVADGKTRVEQELRTLEQHQAVFEEQLAIKGEVEPLIEQNRSRIEQLSQESKGLSAERKAREQQELRLRKRAESLWERASQETDPRLAQLARIEAQAQQAEAQLITSLVGGQATLNARKVVKQRDLELLEAAMSDQLQRVNKYANLWTDPETAKALIDLREMLRPEQAGKILRMHDTVMSRWKAYSLLSPGYHFRNGYSAMFMNAVAGYDGGPQGYIRFGRLWRKAEKDGIEIAAASIKDQAYRDAFERTWARRGSLFGNDRTRDIVDAFEGAGRRRGVLPKRLERVDPSSLDNAALRLNTRTATKVERLVRGPLYIDGLMKGLSEADAYERVIRFHFDYSEGISQFERTVMRRVVPFYTWTRLNFPLQLEYMARNPGVYMKYQHAKQNLELGTAEEQYVPQYLGELGGFRSPASTGGEQGGRIYLAPDLPFLRLGQQFDVDQLASQVTPLIKTPLELDKGTRFFNDIPFQVKPQKVGLAEIPLAPLWEILDGKFGTPRVFRKGATYWYEDEAQGYKVEQALPLLGRMRRLVPNTDKYQERMLTSWLSTGFGLTSTVNGPHQQENEMRRREEEIRAAVTRFNNRKEAA